MRNKYEDKKKRRTVQSSLLSEAETQKTQTSATKYWRKQDKKTKARQDNKEQVK
jgi:hypothetical protein